MYRKLLMLLFVVGLIPLAAAQSQNEPAVKNGDTGVFFQVHHGTVNNNIPTHQLTVSDLNSFTGGAATIAPYVDVGWGPRNTTTLQNAFHTAGIKMMIQTAPNRICVGQTSRGVPNGCTDIPGSYELNNSDYIQCNDGTATAIQSNYGGSNSFYGDLGSSHLQTTLNNDVQTTGSTTVANLDYMWMTNTFFPYDYPQHNGNAVFTPPCATATTVPGSGGGTGTQPTLANGGFQNAGTGPWPATFRAFADSAPINQQAPTNPVYLTAAMGSCGESGFSCSSSAQIVADQFQTTGDSELYTRANEAGSYDYFHPIVFAQASDPVVNLYCVNPSGYTNCGTRGSAYPTTMHIPAVARPAGGSDAHLITVQPDGTVIESWATDGTPGWTSVSGGNCTISNPSRGFGAPYYDGDVRQAQRNWQAGDNYCAYNISVSGSIYTGNGLVNGGPGADVGQISLIAGIITPAEMGATTGIQHALFVTGNCGVGHIYPSNDDTQTCSSGVGPPVGAREWYDVPCATTKTMGYEQWETNILCALNQYGGYMADNGGGGTYFEGGMSGELISEEPWYDYGGFTSYTSPYAYLTSSNGWGVNTISDPYWNSSGVAVGPNGNRYCADACNDTAGRQLDFKDHVHWLAPCNTYPQNCITVPLTGSGETSTPAPSTSAQPNTWQFADKTAYSDQTYITRTNALHTAAIKPVVSEGACGYGDASTAYNSNTIGLTTDYDPSPILQTLLNANSIAELCDEMYLGEPSDQINGKIGGGTKPHLWWSEENSQLLVDSYNGVGGYGNAPKIIAYDFFGDGVCTDRGINCGTINEQDQRGFVFASTMLAYTQGSLGFWALPYSNDGDGVFPASATTVEPEHLLVPLNPVQTASWPTRIQNSSLVASGGFYRREFANCYINGISLNGGCAFVVNPSTTTTDTMNASMFTQTYHHYLTLSGSGAFSAAMNTAYGVPSLGDTGTFTSTSGSPSTINSVLPQGWYIFTVQ